RARTLRQAVPRVRHARAAYRPRGERDQLLRGLSDGRPAHGRSQPLTIVPRRLAAHGGGAGSPTARRLTGLGRREVVMIDCRPVTKRPRRAPGGCAMTLHRSIRSGIAALTVGTLAGCAGGPIPGRLTVPGKPPMQVTLTYTSSLFGGSGKLS